jgi:hypothetical protein
MAVHLVLILVFQLVSFQHLVEEELADLDYLAQSLVVVQEDLEHSVQVLTAVSLQEEEEVLLNRTEAKVSMQVLEELEEVDLVQNQVLYLLFLLDLVVIPVQEEVEAVA